MSGPIVKPGYVLVEVIKGVEGPCLSFGDGELGERVSGPKPWGGARTIHSFKVRATDMVRLARQYGGAEVRTAEDYDTLRTANQRLEGEVARLREALEGMLEYFPEGQSDGECSSVETAKAALAGDGGDARQQRIDQLVALAMRVAALDQLLPHLGKVPADVGLLNDALVAARPLLTDKQHPE